MTGNRHLNMRPVLVLPEAERERIVEHLRSARPNEGVGLIAVEWVEGGDQRIAMTRKFYPGTNFRASPTRYELDRFELIAALRDIDQHNWALGAIVHSHPNSPATPSRTDLAEANYPEALMVIASFATDPPDLQAWYLVPTGAGFAPETATILEDVPVAARVRNCR